jgi:hypothetical protein
MTKTNTGDHESTQPNSANESMQHVKDTAPDQAEIPSTEPKALPEENPAAQPAPSTPEEKTLPKDYKKLSAADLAQMKLFPKDWALIGVNGKDAFTRKWATEKKRHADAICDVKTYSKATGMGVVTGALSGGLIAMDIDGAEAEEAYKLAAGEAYEAVGEEKTMAWTSGKPNRRVLLWRLPEHLI